MSKETNKLIPDLRFPEFKNDGDWKIKTIEDLCDILNNIRKPISSSDRQKGSYPYYGASGIIDYVDDFLFDERLLLVGEDGAKWEAYENTAFLVGGKYWVNNHAHVLRPNLINDKLLESYLVKLNLLPYTTGAAPPKLTLGKLKEIPIPVPDSPKEQQKIASCLTSLDEVIAAHSQKLDLLKDHKKGLMQNLFPQEGEKVPKWRFKEFVGDGEWVEKHLEKIAKKIQDGTHFSPKSFDNGDFLYITSKNVKDGYIELSTAQYISKEDHENIYKRCDVKQGDVLLTKDGTIGQVCVNELTVPFSLLSSVAFIRLKPDFSNYFLYHLLVSQVGQKEIDSQIAGQALKRITLTKINNFCFTFPTLSEQQKIASCLSALDALITAQAEKVEQLKLHKKGLMQGLFPRMSEL